MGGAALPPETAYVWLEGEPPEAEAARALAEWARARGVRLAAPREGGRASRPVDLAVGARVEEELARAHEALAILDLDGTERALARAEAMLRAHPELPQAPWLLAEVHRAWAARFTRGTPRDEGRAARAVAAAIALDGGRASGLGEPEDAAAAPRTVRATIDLVAPSGAELRVDGLPRAPGELVLAEGTHHVVVAVGGAVALAQWVSVHEGAHVRLEPPSSAACSADDLGRASLSGPGLRADGVRCADWVAATSGDRPRTIRVATCRGARCGELLEWSASSGETGPPIVEKARGKGFPAWLAWTLAGLAAAAVATTAIFASGVASPPPTTIQFVQGSPKIEAR
jgi:hypothetical protein